MGLAGGYVGYSLKQRAKNTRLSSRRVGRLSLKLRGDNEVEKQGCQNKFKENKSRYTQNKVLLSVPCAYARETFFRGFHFLRVQHKPLPENNPGQLFPVDRRHPGLCRPDGAGAPGGRIFAFEAGGIFPRKQRKALKSVLFRENFLFIGKNGVYYSFTHTILRST